MSTSTKAGPSRSDRPILEVRQICKSFPGVRVLKSVNLSVWPGEVHAFMCENGAGKSRLMKILAGAYQAVMARPASTKTSVQLLKAKYLDVGRAEERETGERRVVRAGFSPAFCRVEATAAL
jgi:ABC-type branched-subunit amino acid transport system ATPase component